MVFGKLKTVGVDPKLHELLKHEAARSSEASGRHVSVREWLWYAMDQRNEALAENEQLRAENEYLRQQLENVETDAEYRQKVEDRALDGIQEIIAYTAEIVELADKTAVEVDALAQGNEDAQKSVDAQKLVIALRNNIFARRVQMNEDANKLKDQIKVVGKHE